MTRAETSRILIARLAASSLRTCATRGSKALASDENGNAAGESTVEVSQHRPGGNRSDAVARLKSVRGHLDAVIRMLENDTYCIDVLYQMRAVEGGLMKARRSILEGHLRTCVSDAYAEGRVDDVIEELLSAFFNDRTPSKARTRGHEHHHDH